MSLVLKAAPAAEPVSLEEAKAHLRVDGGEENALISALIVSAREFAEKTTRRAFISQTWELVLDAAGGEIEIPLPPLQEVTRIETIDEERVRSVVDAGAYVVDVSACPARIRLKSGFSWPTHRGFASFVATFKAGYGDAAEDVPENIRTAILHLVALLYENRSALDVLFSTHPMTNQQQLIMILLQPYRILRF